MVTPNQVLRSQILYGGICIQRIYHRTKFECSSFSGLANIGGWGAKPPDIQLAGQCIHMDCSSFAESAECEYIG